MENRRAKMLIVILCIVCLAASSVACAGGGDAENAGSRQPTGKEGLPPSDETEPSVEPEIVEAAPIPAEEIALTDGENTLRLDMPFDRSEWRKWGTPIEDGDPLHPVAGYDAYYDGIVFSQFVYFYYEGTIDVSNKYDYKNRNLSDYYVTRVFIESSRYSTPKGVRVGDSVERLFEVYGESKKMPEKKPWPLNLNNDLVYGMIFYDAVMDIGGVDYRCSMIFRYNENDMIANISILIQEEI